jgi:hypothetical protein
MASGRLLLKEKILGNILKNHDWTQYQDQFCGSQLQYGRHCSGMASILVTTNLFLLPKSNKWNIDDLNAALYEELLAKIDTGVC